MTLINKWQPNQSLKLTEPAVDDLTRAKQPATIGRDLARANGQPCRHNFRRQLSSGPLGGVRNGNEAFEITNCCTAVFL